MTAAVIEKQSYENVIAVNAPQVRELFARERLGGLRAREAAQALGLPEGAVIGAHAGEHGASLQARPLRPEWLSLLKALEACGPVMALTRNESTVHEKTGVYRKLSAQGPVGLALGREIDLRLFFTQWHAGYAVTEQSAAPGKTMHSLQFFNAQGLAVHKIYAREATDMQAWQALVERFAEPSAGYVFRRTVPCAVVKPDVDIDVAGLRSAWAAMQDTHEFFDLLKRFGAERQQALHLVEGDFCERLAPRSLQGLLDAAALDALPIMVFVGSPGCIQIHTGPVRNIKPLALPGKGEWLNVLDEDFSLHLRCDQIDAVWLVRKPTADGVVTSVEAFDAQGELMAMFFGERKPGNPELGAWRQLAEQLPRLEPAGQSRESKESA